MPDYLLTVAVLSLLCCCTCHACSSKVPECHCPSKAQCPAGMFLQGDPKEALCVPCAAGTFKNNAGNQVCSPCSKGSFSAEGATSCTDCPAGTYSGNSGSQRCEKCPAGSYKNTAGNQMCSPCSNGSFSAEGATSCLADCPAGYNGISGSQRCDMCPAGTYKNTAGNQMCSPCSKGSFSVEGATSCTDCPAGTYSNNSGSQRCISCSDFQYSQAGAVACSDCPSGALVKSDRVNCYRKVTIKECSPKPYYPNGSRPCLRVFDGNREGMPFIDNGTSYYMLITLTEAAVRKVVLWRRMDCCPEQFIGIRVFVGHRDDDTGFKSCGAVISADTPYAIFNCVHQAQYIQLQWNKQQVISLTEVEAYMD